MRSRRLPGGMSDDGGGSGTAESLRIVVVGASGRTGRPLVERALAAGHVVVAFVRDADRLDVDVEDDARGRLVVVEGDAYAGEGLAAAVAGADAVVSVLGHTSDGPDDLLTVAGDRVLAAMDEAGVRRYVTLVGAGVREDGESVSVAGRVMGGLLRVVARDRLEDSAAHVARVRDSGLDWTVVRAPRLTDGPATGAYRAGELRLGFESVPRADVAAFLLDCVEDGSYVGEAPQVASA
jgi:putative NADH-flavin reductase